MRDDIYIDILNTVMDSVNEWVVVVDRDAKITMMSKAYKEFLGEYSPEGKHVTEVIDNTKMHEIVKSGKSIIGDIQYIRGNRMIAMRVPVKKDGLIIGAVGKVMFKDISDYYSLGKQITKLEKELEYYKNELGNERSAKYFFSDIIGDSEENTKVKEIATRAAKTRSNVLIIGESGTGKELLAHAIHNASYRRQGPFVKINCAAIPEELIESELFGYEEGAFTGAKKSGKKGKFELANNGTILLDEIGDMPLSSQVKLLRVLQEREIEKVGGNVVKEIDVRIISSTNKNLKKAIEEGKFREDLYYRLNVIRISVPPLRNRKKDIEPLANILKRKVADKLGIYVEGISKEAMERLKEYDWPGNIRELENAIERSINMLDSDIYIQEKHLPEKLIQKKSTYIRDTKGKYLKDIVAEVEKEIISDCLNSVEWNKNKAAKILGISRVGLYKKIEYYNLSDAK
ncbi:sigma 54-interacting transcriptional regulator [Clostridium sardiniense]|uniref:Sigma 54-interacting transcriptional regulator n=1 Tax=Clostridium sardiniense TaxID=29369 RepID=A0ABS7KTS4_CLOSR|nr:sigma 54-interacting transcriptional regulator [Clostridium sardiniense]MBY0754206.1 sigma 54-interacting transcriptional regulator [Clostridium sardiniense]